MSDGGVSEREFGQLEQKVKELPTHGDLRSTVMELQRMLEKHESRTERLIEHTATTTVESAFKLQWSEIEKYLHANAPPKRDWLPYVMAGGVILLAGAQEAFPFVMRAFSSGV
jgi:hypothetical protein